MQFRFPKAIRPLAVKDLEGIVRYLDANSSQAGDHFLEAFSAAIDLLSALPRAGHLRRSRGRLKGLRSWPLTRFGPYILFYLPTPNGIEVLRILHGARNIDRELHKISG